jgi:hypothetical protein
MCKGKLGGCGVSGERKENPVKKKILIVCCILIIGTAAGFGLLSNFYMHLIFTRGGINWIVTVFQQFQSYLNTVQSQAAALNMTQDLPVDINPLLADVKTMVDHSEDIQEDILVGEQVRLLFSGGLFVATYLLCLLGLIAVFYYRKVVSRVTFVFGFIFLSVVFFYLGGFQLPMTLMTSDLCKNWEAGVEQYIPESKPYFKYYLLCDGNDPFASFNQTAEQLLIKLKNETNPSDKTKQEIEDLEVMLAALLNMTCNSTATEFSMNGLYTYENYLYCNNFINDLTITFLVFLSIGIFGFLLLFVGLKHDYSDANYRPLHEELGLFSKSFKD